MQEPFADHKVTGRSDLVHISTESTPGNELGQRPIEHRADETCLLLLLRVVGIILEKAPARITWPVNAFI